MSYTRTGAPVPGFQMAPNRSALGQHLSYLYSSPPAQLQKLMLSGVKAQTPSGQVLRVHHGPSPSMDGPSKGLLNGPGQNNCFLNCAVQVSAPLCFFLIIWRNYWLHHGATGYYKTIYATQSDTFEWGWMRTMEHQKKTFKKY